MATLQQPRTRSATVCYLLRALDSTVELRARQTDLLTRPADWLTCPAAFAIGMRRSSLYRHRSIRSCGAITRTGSRRRYRLVECAVDGPVGRRRDLDGSNP